MRTNARWWVTAAALVGLGVWAAAGSGRAADEGGDLKGKVQKIASTLQQGNMDEAKTQAGALKDAELEDVMGLFKLRTKKGLGVGSAPDTVKPDGIEAMFLNMGKRVDKNLVNKHSDDLAQAAYISAAIALIAHDKCPVKEKMGCKDPKKWTEWSEEMLASSQNLAKAFQAKDAAAVKTAANKLNASCNNCHSAFRD